MKIIQTDNAPAAVGPYSQGIVVNGFLYCSGQIGIDPQTGDLAEGIENQTKQVLQNLLGVITSANADKSSVVKTTIYLKNMDDYAKVNEIYGAFFAENKPARVTVGVAKLPKDALIEIDAIAEVNK